MSTTTFHEGNATWTLGGHVACRCSDELMARYRAFLAQERLSWTEHHRMIRQLGSGGQGVVYLSERRGTDDFTLPVALKVFSPERYEDERSYDEAMGRIAQVSAHIAQIQQDNLLDVHNWVEHRRIRLMEMEWIDGFDLSQLLTQKTLDWLYQHVSAKRWNEINAVVVTAGRSQPRVKPGIAIAIIRDCLAALAALHRENIIHGDLKPSNIMLKFTGTAKIVDVGSAFDLSNVPPHRTCTPVYAAPEVLEHGESSPQSDLASLGYLLVEMLSGAPAFEECTTLKEMLEAKRLLAQRLPKLLPAEVTCNDLLMSFCRGLVAPDPARRFRSAEEADLRQEGAANFLRQLVKGNLASEYHNEIRLWLRDLEDFPK
jgi:serine/threonine-protein kinase